MEVEQAIFTSTSALMSQGYRLAAASRGVTAAERSTISRMSPSHEAMCDSSNDAVGVAFYGLDSGRYGIGYTCHAGQEQSGRGGKRVLTRVFVLDGEQMLMFGNNPFAVLRGLSLDEPIDLSSLSSNSLERVSVGADKAANGARVVSAAVGQLGLEGVQYLVGQVMDSRRAVVAGLDDPSTAVEAALLATPLPMRLECSFTIGLKFALGRRYRLALIGDDVTAVKRTCRGQPIELVETLGPGSVPATEPTRWVAMAGDCYERGRLDGLVGLAGRQFDDVSSKALDAIADRQVSLNHIGEASMGELLQTLLGDEPARGDLERDLQSEYATEAARRIAGLAASASCDSLREHRSALVELSSRDSAFDELCGGLIGRIDALDSTANGTGCSASGAGLNITSV